MTTTSTVHLGITNTTLRLALAYVIEHIGHRLTVHDTSADVLIADLGYLAAKSIRVDALVVDPLPLPCRQAVEQVLDGKAAAAITSDEPEALAHALESASLGIVTITRAIIERANSLPHLPERLDATLRYVVAGHSNTGIARDLHQSESTVKRDIAALLRHFGAANRQALAGAAAAAGFTR